MSERDEIKLLPCPFCGGDAFLHDDGEGQFAYIACNVCINQTVHFFNGRDIVIERWNARRGIASEIARERERIADDVDRILDDPSFEIVDHPGYEMLREYIDGLRSKD